MEGHRTSCLVGALAGGIALAARYGIHSTSGRLAAAGAVGYVLVLIITLPTNLRMNHQIESWSIQNPPREWGKRARDGFGSTLFELYSPFPRLPFMFLP